MDMLNCAKCGNDWTNCCFDLQPEGKRIRLAGYVVECTNGDCRARGTVCATEDGAVAAWNTQQESAQSEPEGAIK